MWLRNVSACARPFDSFDDFSQYATPPPERQQSAIKLKQPTPTKRSVRFVLFWGGAAGNGPFVTRGTLPWVVRGGSARRRRRGRPPRPRTFRGGRPQRRR